MADPKFKPSERLARAAAVRSALETNPDATIDELARTVGVSTAFAQDVRHRWRTQRRLAFSEPFGLRL